MQEFAYDVAPRFRLIKMDIVTGVGNDNRASMWKLRNHRGGLILRHPLLAANDKDRALDPGPLVPIRFSRLVN